MCNRENLAKTTRDLVNLWTDPATNTELYTFTIIITHPNPVVGAYYDREPVQLPRELEKAWLNPNFTEPEQIMPMLKTSSPDQMESWHVADEAKNPKNDYPELLTPVAVPAVSKNRQAAQ